MVLQTLNFNHFNPRSYQYFPLYQHTIVIKRSLSLIPACMRHGYVKVTHVSNALATRRLLNDSGRTAQQTHSVSVIKTNQWMLYREITAVFSEILENISKIECCEVKQDGTKWKRWDFKELCFNRSGVWPYCIAVRNAPSLLSSYTSMPIWVPIDMTSATYCSTIIKGFSYVVMTPECQPTYIIRWGSTSITPDIPKLCSAKHLQVLHKEIGKKNKINRTRFENCEFLRPWTVYR